MANTMTKVQKFSAIAKALEGVELDGFDVQEFLASEIAQTEKRNKRKSISPSKTQRENAEIKVRILELLTDGAARTATEIARALDLSSPQKASALLKQLVAEGSVKKDKDGRKTTFTIVTTE